MTIEPYFTTNQHNRFSEMAKGLLGSEILKIASDIRGMIAKGQKIGNLTVGDFSPAEFRIPQFMEDAIRRHYAQGQTNYPPSDGMLELRNAIVGFYKTWLDVEYPVKSVLVASGARPLIYSLFRAIVDPGDKVVYPVPTWNNNNFVQMLGAQGVPVHCHEEHAFLPTVELLKPHLHDARLICLNSPLNPSGTAFSRQELEAICDMILEENKRRTTEDALYLMYDQVYWMLTFGKTEHFNPVRLRPEIAPYTVMVDAVSKAFAATGVRVGWCVGPPDIIERMSAILGHVGAWAPRAEQMATAELLNNKEEIIKYHSVMKVGVQDRLNALYDGLSAMAKDGLPIKTIVPMGAIYLSVQFNFLGRKKPDGTVFTNSEEIRQYLLFESQIGVVPFKAFGYQHDTGWFRLSVGAVSMKDIEEALPRLRRILEKLV